MIAFRVNRMQLVNSSTKWLKLIILMAADSTRRQHPRPTDPEARADTGTVPYWYHYRHRSDADYDGYFVNVEYYPRSDTWRGLAALPLIGALLWIEILAACKRCRVSRWL
jgi:hypothetical protein